MGADDPGAGRALLQWLALVGWRIRIQRGPGEVGVATAEHLTVDGRRLEVRASGTTLPELAGLLFERVMALRESGVEVETPQSESDAA